MKNETKRNKILARFRDTPSWMCPNTFQMTVMLAWQNFFYEERHFLPCHKRGTKKKFWEESNLNPEVSIPHEDSEFFLCPTLVIRRKKHISLFLYRAQKLIVFFCLQNLFLYILFCIYFKRGFLQELTGWKRSVTRALLVQNLYK